MNIQELKAKKSNYVHDKVISIIEGMEKRNKTIDYISTCDYRNWDVELHYAMPSIASELRELGFGVTSQVNHGVTDWTITV